MVSDRLTPTGSAARDHDRAVVAPLERHVGGPVLRAGGAMVHEAHRGKRRDRADRRGRVRRGAAGDLDLDAIVVERERADRRGVPPEPLRLRPAGRAIDAVEQPVVHDQVAGDLPDARRLDGLGELARDGHRAGMDAAGKTRVAAADDDQVALEHAVLDRAVGDQRRAELVIRAQFQERGGGGEDLRVRGQLEQLVAVEGEDLFAVREPPRDDADLARRARDGGPPPPAARR